MTATVGAIGESSHLVGLIFEVAVIIALQVTSPEDCGIRARSSAKPSRFVARTFACLFVCETKVPSNLLNVDMTQLVFEGQVKPVTVALRHATLKVAIWASVVTVADNGFIVQEVTALQFGVVLVGVQAVTTGQSGSVLVEVHTTGFACIVLLQLTPPVVAVMVAVP